MSLRTRLPEGMSRARPEYEPDIAARTAMLSAVGWVVIASSTAALVRIRLLFPDILTGAGFLSYGRLRALEDTFSVFGWLSMAGLAAVFAVVPRLAGARLYNEILGSTAAVWWTGTIFVASATLLVPGTVLGAQIGYNQGRPYAELPIAADAVLGFLLLLVAFNTGMTVARRRERTLYVSVWYLLAAVVWFPIVLAAGNLTILSGIVDWIVNGFYVQGLFWLWLAPVGLGVAYYVVPDATGNPLHSRQLSFIGFWTLALAGGWTGQVTGVWGPAPDYLETIAIVMSAVLVVPVLSTVSNLYATGRGRWGLLADEYGLRFVATGLGGLALWAGITAATAARSPSRVLGLTAFRAGLDVLAVWGVFSAFAFGLVYHMYPRLVGRAWYSRRLCAFHFWTTLGSAAAAATLLMVHGAIQGETSLAWSRAGDLGGYARLVQELALSARAFQVLGAVAMCVLALAQLALMSNVYMTSRRGDPLQLVQAPVHAGSVA